MIERYIATALRTGVSFYVAEGAPALAAIFTRQFDVTPHEINRMAAYLTKFTPEVKLGYPRDAITAAPSIFIFLSSSSQPGFALAGLAGVGAAPAAAGTQAQAAQAAVGIPYGGTNFAAPVANTLVRSSIWSHQFQIMILARAGGPEPVIWTSIIAQSILIGAKRYFDTKGLLTPVLAMSDVNFRADLAPNDLYARTISFQCSREFTQSDTSGGFQRALSIAGINQPVFSGADDGRPTSGFTLTPKGLTPAPTE